MFVFENFSYSALYFVLYTSNQSTSFIIVRIFTYISEHISDLSEHIDSFRVLYRMFRNFCELCNIIINKNYI